MIPITILHLVGSPTSAFYQELSELYARGCIEAVADPVRYRTVVAHVEPTGGWRFPLSLDETDVAAAVRMNLPQALDRLAHSGIDVALPQMFCERGVSEYRAIFELLGIPYLGNRPTQMAIAADKSKARAIVSAAGVDVPPAILLARGEPVTSAKLPVVVKPVGADNSDGVSLVRDESALLAAVEDAFEHSDHVLVERYIELGREVRCGVVERDGQLMCLPLEEYFVDEALRPIRSRADKLKRNSDGELILAAKTDRESWIVDSADPIVPAVHAAALSCHRALGLRQYSLFDFRIDPTGRPWFLEAGPYCSFAPDSVIVTMMAASGVPLNDFFATAIADVIASSRAMTVEISR